jgi:hypothetical protein
LSDKFVLPIHPGIHLEGEGGENINDGKSQAATQWRPVGVSVSISIQPEFGDYRAVVRELDNLFAVPSQADTRMSKRDGLTVLTVSWTHRVLIR